MQSCGEDGMEFTSPASNNGVINSTNLTTSGTVTDTENGYLVDGTLTMDTQASGTIVFNNANLDVEFDANGNLASVSGTAEIPSSSNYFEFEDPIQADIGFFTGEFLNNNRNFEIQLVDERTYFVFAISVNLELKLGANDNPDAQKPLSISPLGGSITYIADYTDPMFFFSLGGDALGGGDTNDNDGNNGDNNNNSSHQKLAGVSFGASLQSNLMYIPTNPIPGEDMSFEANQVTGGSVSFFKILSVSGMYFQNRGFDVDANFDEPMASNFGANYRAGINGKLDLELEIASFINFGFPIGSGSAAIVAEASTNNGIVAKAFINGLIEPDLSWWPEFIPIKPGGYLNAYGFVEQTGNFDIGLSGELNLETPTGEQSIGGFMQATPQAFTMGGQVTINDETWEANATFTKDETKVVATPPVSFTDGIAETVTGQIDTAIETTEQAISDLEAANEAYEFELSLRGLRAALPGIINNANSEIDKAVASAVASGESQANSILRQYTAALCSTNISSKVNGIVAPYRNALTRLKNAVNDSNDNTQTRTEIEAALRQLVSLDNINKNVSVKITYGNKAFNNPSPIPDIKKCSIWSTSTNRNVNVKATVLNTEHKAQLLEAADNVKFISETHGLRFDAQVIVDQLPTVEELENLKDGAEACISELTDGLEKSGFTYYHDSKQFKPFIIVNGEEKEVSDFNIFNAGEVVNQARIKTDNCNPDDALKRLQFEAKNRRK